MNAVPDDPGSIDQVPVPSSPRPRVIVFDVNETLSDMSTMPKRFVDVGAPSPLAGLWFGGLLRDGFALSAAGNAEKFADVGSGLLKAMLHGVELNRPLDAAVEHIMDGFAMLDVHPDVADGVVALAELGIRMVTLSNGSVGVAEKLPTAWLNRDGGGYPDYFHAPDVEATSFVRLALHFGSDTAS